ncbi:MAG: cytochrome c biogenesis protein CcsA [Magnetococcales bacterium]|nr:cytochrome c biogenesis protein CcsA [Magnetococcales bacterium]
MAWATATLLAFGLWLVFTAPPDFQQGVTVRIMYVHVPSAKMSLLIYLLLTLVSLLFLWKGYDWADRLSEAATPVGAAFAAVTLVTGSIWGKPMWGAWWAWDARLTSMLVLLVLYVGLIALRSAFDDARRGARSTAVMVLVGAVDLPIIHYSVQWWRTLHQPASFNGPTSAIAAPLLWPLLVMSVAFLALACYMVLLKFRLVTVQRQLEEKLEQVEAS